jgi:xanthine dehydrogenase iron-sulfur cluster and FAD-binding subunit A
MQGDPAFAPHGPAPSADPRHPVEAWNDQKRLHSIQMAFIKHDALQCGLCTAGMVRKAYSLLAF